MIRHFRGDGWMKRLVFIIPKFDGLEVQVGAYLQVLFLWSLKKVLESWMRKISCFSVPNPLLQFVLLQNIGFYCLKYINFQVTYLFTETVRCEIEHGFCTQWETVDREQFPLLRHLEQKGHLVFPKYLSRSDPDNSKTVNSHFHLIQTFVIILETFLSFQW